MSEGGLSYTFKPQEIYRKHLSESDSRLPGHLLWIPEPNRQLPKEYRAQGTLIGDVGILTPQGGFSFLFNILRPSSDSINPNNLPQQFCPLTSQLDSIDMLKDKVFSESSHLSRPFVSCVQGGASEKLYVVYFISVWSHSHLSIVYLNHLVLKARF